jgi:hypothetical protein
MPDAPAPPIVIQKRRGKGCWAWGCGCGALLVIAVLIVSFLVLAYRGVSTISQAYTSPGPVDIPTSDAGDAIYRGAQGKLAAFTQAFGQEQPATLRLNSDDINTLIARDPNYAAMRGKLHVTLQGDTVQVDSSVLLGTLEKVVMTDRYLNSVVTLGVGFDPDKHAVLFNVRQLQFNGQLAPSDANAVIDQDINTIVNQRLQANQLAKDFLARVQRIDIENGELVIEIR